MWTEVGGWKGVATRMLSCMCDGVGGAKWLACRRLGERRRCRLRHCKGLPIIKIISCWCLDISHNIGEPIKIKGSSPEIVGARPCGGPRQVKRRNAVSCRNYKVRPQTVMGIGEVVGKDGCVGKLVQASIQDL